jgi:hypothetical protein
MVSYGWDGAAMPVEPTGITAAWRAITARKAQERPAAPPPWLTWAMERPAAPPAWIGASARKRRRRPGGVNAVAMMKRLHDSITAIEAAQAERQRRNAPHAQRAMRLYEETRRQHLGETTEQPSMFVAAALGLGQSHIRIF